MNYKRYFQIRDIQVLVCLIRVVCLTLVYIVVMPGCDMDTLMVYFVGCTILTGMWDKDIARWVHRKYVEKDLPTNTKNDTT